MIYVVQWTIFQFAYLMGLCKVSFVLTLDIVLKYMEYLIKTSLPHPYWFSFFPYLSTELSMFCCPPSLFNDILLILKYVFEYILRSFCSIGLIAFNQNGFTLYSAYSSTYLAYSWTLQDIISILSLLKCSIRVLKLVLSAY